MDRRDPGFWRRLPLGAVAAAAAVLVVVVGVVGLARSTGEDSTDTASQDLSQDAAQDATQDEGAAMGSTSDDAAELEASEVPSAFSDRARFADVDDLADHLHAELTAQATASAEANDTAGASQDPDATAGGGTTAAGGGDGTAEPSSRAYEDDPCGAVELLGVDPSSVVAVVPALVGARAVTAVVHGAGDERRLVVVDDGTCATIDERPL